MQHCRDLFSPYQICGFTYSSELQVVCLVHLRNHTIVNFNTPATIPTEVKEIVGRNKSLIEMKREIYKACVHSIDIGELLQVWGSTTGSSIPPIPVSSAKSFVGLEGLEVRPLPTPSIPRHLESWPNSQNDATLPMSEDKTRHLQVAEGLVDFNL